MQIGSGVERTHFQHPASPVFRRGSEPLQTIRTLVRQEHAHQEIHVGADRASVPDRPSRTTPRQQESMPGSPWDLEVVARRFAVRRFPDDQLPAERFQPFFRGVIRRLMIVGTCRGPADVDDDGSLFREPRGPQCFECFVDRVRPRNPDQRACPPGPLNQSPMVAIACSHDEQGFSVVLGQSPPTPGAMLPADLPRTRACPTGCQHNMESSPVCAIQNVPFSQHGFPWHSQQRKEPGGRPRNTDRARTLTPPHPPSHVGLQGQKRAGKQ